MKTKNFFNIISDLWNRSENYKVYDIDFNPAIWAGFCKFGELAEDATPNNYVDSRMEICIDKYRGTVSASTYCANDYGTMYSNDNEHIVHYQFSNYFSGLNILRSLANIGINPCNAGVLICK